MKTVRYVCTFAILCAIILSLSACGGGGSDEESPNLPPDQKLNNYCTTTPQPCNK